MVEVVMGLVCNEWLLLNYLIDESWRKEPPPCPRPEPLDGSAICHTLSVTLWSHLERQDRV